MPPLLDDKKILITREKKQAHLFSEKITRHGGVPIEAPLLKINCHMKAKNDRIMASLSRYEWIFFTSANGVDCFFQMMNEEGVTKRALATSQIAVVGHKTELALKKHRYTAHFIPSVYKATVMANEFLINHPTANNILLVRGSRSKDVLLDHFLKQRLSVDLIEVYETIFNYEIDSFLNEQLRKGIDFITFTSPSTVEAFIEMTAETTCLDIVCVCIGTTTEKRAKELGFKKTLTPNEFTIEGMIERMGDFLELKG